MPSPLCWCLFFGLERVCLLLLYQSSLRGKCIFKITYWVTHFECHTLIRQLLKVHLSMAFFLIYLNFRLVNVSNHLWRSITLYNNKWNTKKCKMRARLYIFFLTMTLQRAVIPRFRPPPYYSVLNDQQYYLFLYLSVHNPVKEASK